MTLASILGIVLIVACLAIVVIALSERVIGRTVGNRPAVALFWFAVLMAAVAMIALLAYAASHPGATP